MSSTTSVLLSDPQAFFRFAEHSVVLPVVVITELEGKRHDPEIGYFARQALRHLDDLRIEHGRLDFPVEVGEGGTLRVELGRTPTPRCSRPVSASATTTPASPLGRDASRAGWSGRHDRLEGPADACEGRIPGLRAEGVPSPSRRWTPGGPGSRRSTSSGDDISDLYESEVGISEQARGLPVNTGLIIHSERGSALGRVTGDGEYRLVRGDRDIFGMHGRSAEQRIAIDLLLDQEVGIVSLGGRAGTGKSALALCAGLEAVLERQQQKKIIVFRPLFAVGGQELGYPPR